jgi:diaminopimelate epimerase
MTIETDAGIIGAEIGDGGAVTLSLQPPRSFRPQRPLVVGEKTIHGSSILVGVPHYVVYLRDELWSQNIDPLGRAIRTHPELRSDGGANANFVVVRDLHHVEVRTWERGVEGETLSCGSGVVASAVMTALFGRARSPVSVLTRGGIELRDGAVENVQLKGDARHIYRATITPETLEGFDPEWVRDPAASVTVSQ